MTYQEFMELAQRYYGPYPENGEVSKFVMAYLRRDIDETKLDRLFRLVTYSHGHRFGPPGIADIEKAITEAIRSGRGTDVHKIGKGNPDLLEVSDEEYKQGISILSQTGGLKALMEKALDGKNVRGKE